MKSGGYCGEVLSILKSFRPAGHALPELVAIKIIAFDFCNRVAPSRLHAFPQVFRAPRMFMAASPSCKPTSARALSCSPQTIHKALLTRKTQNPVFRRDSFFEATSHDAASVTAIAGH